MFAKKTRIYALAMQRSQFNPFAALRAGFAAFPVLLVKEIEIPQGYKANPALLFKCFIFNMGDFDLKTKPTEKTYGTL